MSQDYYQQYNDQTANYDSTNSYGQQQAVKYQDGLPEEGEDSGFLGRSRSGFVRKVYLIVFTQLLITAGFCAISCLNFNYLVWQANSWWMFFVTFSVSMFTQIALLCNRNIATRVPINYIVLFIFTASFSYSVSYICGMTSLNITSITCYTYECEVTYTQNAAIVLEAAGITCGMVLGLTAAALIFKKMNFWINMLFMVAFLYMSVFFFWLIFYSSTSSRYYYYRSQQIMNMIWCSFGVIIFGIYIIIDTQLIVGGSRLGGQKFEISFDDYIFAAMILYVDIIRLFLYILYILKGSKR